MLHHGYPDFSQDQQLGHYSNTSSAEYYGGCDRLKVNTTNSFLSETSYDQNTAHFPEEDLYDASYALVHNNSERSLRVESCHATCWEGTQCDQRPDISQLHAPVPLPGCAPILRAHSYHLEGSTSTASVGCSVTHFLPSQIQADRQLHSYIPVPQIAYGHLLPPPSAAPSQPTFLTPSELLVELSTKENHNTPQPHHSSRPRLWAPAKSSRSEISNRAILDMTTVMDTSFAAPLPAGTGQESISSHEKKRYYLECVEHYVKFLHEHFRLIGLEPAPIERIPISRGLSSRSIRSLLIHMENLTKQMKEQISKEEQKFLELRDVLHRQEAATHTEQSMQHST